jgi:hypothetical protein
MHNGAHHIMKPYTAAHSNPSLIGQLTYPQLLIVSSFANCDIWFYVSAYGKIINFRIERTTRMLGQLGDRF